MQRFKRFVGLKIFLALWLLVALVPAWRQYAVRQFRYGPLPPVEMGLPSGLTPANEQRIARLAPDDDVAQLIGIPLLTATFYQSQTSPRLIRDWQNKADIYLDRHAALARRFPNSTLVRSQWLCRAAAGPLPIETEAQLKTYSYRTPSP